MNKDELKEKADHLKERVKEAFGDNKKKAEGFIERMREYGAREDRQGRRRKARGRRGLTT